MPPELYCIQRWDDTPACDVILRWYITRQRIRRKAGLVILLIILSNRNRDSLLVKAPDSWSKGWEFESRQQRREKSFVQSQLCVLILNRCPFQPRVTAMARKRPRSFCQKCRWQVTPKHTYTTDPTNWQWADYAAVQAECGNLSGNKLARNSSGNTRSQSFQLAEPLWTDPGLQVGISLRELISALKKNAGREWMVEHSPQILACEEKATTTTLSKRVGVTLSENGFQ